MKKLLVAVIIVVAIALFASYKCSRSRAVEYVENHPETSQAEPVPTEEAKEEAAPAEEAKEEAVPVEEVKKEPAPAKKEKQEAKPASEKAEKPAENVETFHETSLQKQPKPAEKKQIQREEKPVTAEKPVPEVKRAPNEADIDSAGVTKVINVSRAAIKRCYDKALTSNPMLKGKLSVKITINEQGRVSRTDIVDDSLHDAEVSKCVKGVIGRLRFPKPAGGSASVTFPFAFDPKN